MGLRLIVLQSQVLCRNRPLTGPTEGSTPAMALEDPTTPGRYLCPEGQAIISRPQSSPHPCFVLAITPFLVAASRANGGYSRYSTQRFSSAPSWIPGSLTRYPSIRYRPLGNFHQKFPCHYNPGSPSRASSNAALGGIGTPIRGLIPTLDSLSVTYAPVTETLIYHNENKSQLNAAPII
jgi:hypothetical protein